MAIASDGKPERLESWKAIATYLQRDLRTVQRWERTRGLPVHRLPGGGRGAVYALLPEIEKWQQDDAPLVRSGRRQLWMRGLLLFAGLSIFVSLVVLVYSRYSRQGAEYRIVPLTTLRGDERWPVFSPDDRRVAFGWRREGMGYYELYAIEPGTVVPTHLAGRLDSAPAWSHHGRFIAFEKLSPDGGRILIMVVSASGGEERQVVEVAMNSAGRFPPQLAWTGDDQALIAADRGGLDEPFHLALISVATGEKRAITKPPPGYRGDQAPAVSPDGGWLAFIRVATISSRDLWLYQLTRQVPATEPRRLTFEGCCVSNPAWAPSGQDILYSSQESESLAIRSLSVAGLRRPVLVTAQLRLSMFSVSPWSGRIAFSTSRYVESLWRLDRSTKVPVPVVSSTRNNQMPDVSPDSKAITFSSDQNGTYEIWTSSYDGSTPVRLTGSGRGNYFTPRWSPDGRSIAFECDGDICTVPAEGGTVVQVTDHVGNNVLPAWSRDGRRIYFGSSRSGKFQIWKVILTPEGRGAAPVQLTKLGGYGGVESPDGATFYYAKSEQGGQIWSVPVNGGMEAPLPVPLRYYQRPENFTARGSGLFSISFLEEDQSFQVQYWRYGSSAIEQMATLRGTPGTGLSVAPDESFLLYSAADNQHGDLMLLDKLR